MTMTLNIPDDVAAFLPEAERRCMLQLELACSLYAKGMITLAQGAAISGLSRVDFGCEVGTRGIPRHYGAADLAEDLAHADSF